MQEAICLRYLFPQQNWHLRPSGCHHPLRILHQPVSAGASFSLWHCPGYDLKTVAAGALISLCIEILQLPFPSRASDIDDLILNTLGTAVGYGI